MCRRWITVPLAPPTGQRVLVWKQISFWFVFFCFADFSFLSVCFKFNNWIYSVLNNCQQSSSNQYSDCIFPENAISLNSLGFLYQITETDREVTAVHRIIHKFFLFWNCLHIFPSERFNLQIRKYIFVLFLLIKNKFIITLFPLVTSLRKFSSLSLSLSSRMSACRLSSELHLRFCRTVRVRFPVSWQNLSKRDRSAHTWDRPAGGVAKGLGGLQRIIKT